MGGNIAIIQGHPDPSPQRYGRALAAAYAQGAAGAGHQVRTVEVASLEFPLLRTKADWETGTPVQSIREAQDVIRWADHLAIFYPLWAGSMPALLRAFLEQVFRPGFAVGSRAAAPGRKLLEGRTARIVVTMGMPAFFYRWVYFAHSVRSLERNILRFCGIAPVKVSLIGMAEATDPAPRAKWLEKMRAIGASGDAGYLSGVAISFANSLWLIASIRRSRKAL
jgi:putative NADPH-quinone reductase